ncbi:flavin-containing monooxygenase [Nocardia sp. NPDC059764]|uniref:flavin-containing monooxygenase n=1 Tax=Nocardia sp. NPDC059764 TaxID=3346939 RepID=UPI00365B8A23
MSASSATAPTEHLDVLIIGAGVSGIGAAYYLRQRLPGKTFAILEARDDLGGTWDLFRYPGIRSDSDLHTFGYAFKPWENRESIAGGPAILSYLRETADQYGIGSHIRFHRRVLGASWSSETARWLVEVENTGTGQCDLISCSWLFSCAGYYRYDEGFTPRFPGSERFTGQVVHPQHWPRDLDYQGKKVVIIGSGATAVTLVPALAETAGHVTMLQRSPTYVVPVPSQDKIANALRAVLGSRRGYALTRRRYVAQQRFVYRFCQRFPQAARRVIRGLNARRLPRDFPVDTHFNPTYNPWDQRLCAVPDSDLFKSISSGAASVVTDRIDTFTENGIALASGQHLEADIIVTATGLNMCVFGDIELTVDGEAVSWPDTTAYKGCMLSDIPNFSFMVGYTNSSWTLKVSPVCEFLCRILERMGTGGHDICYPHAADQAMPTRPLLDFSAGYVQRSLHLLPRQGPTAPWTMAMDYLSDVKTLSSDPFQDRQLRFTEAGRSIRPSATGQTVSA